MKKEHLHILQHSLGVDQYGQGHQYRNHFVTGPGSKDFNYCMELVFKGYLVDRGCSHLIGGDHYFVVTSEGIDAVALKSPTPPKISRSKQRYHDYLRSDCGMSFIDWLRWLHRREKE